MFIDSHAHLNMAPLFEQLPQIRLAMAAAQVNQAICICTQLEEFAPVHALATAYENFWATVGVHPDYEEVTEPSVDDLLRLAALPKVVAIGETGLDYYRLQGRSSQDMEWQRQRFKVHIEASIESGKPLVVHTRNASLDTLALLRSFNRPLRGVFHCFTESLEVAKAALDLGFYISFSGILTFKNAQGLRDVASQIPLSRCLIETDSPYLAPMPHRGKVNSPAWVPLVAQALADVQGHTVDHIAQVTAANAQALFALPAGAAIPIGV